MVSWTQTTGQSGCRAWSVPRVSPVYLLMWRVYRSTLHNHEYQTSPTWFAVCFLFSKFVTTGEEWTFESKALSHTSFTLIHEQDPEILNSSNHEDTVFFLHGDWTKMMRRRPQNQKNNPICGGPLKVGETKKKLYVCFRLILLSFPGPGCHSDARWRQQAKTRWSASKVVLYTTTVAV